MKQEAKGRRWEYRKIQVIRYCMRIYYSMEQERVAGKRKKGQRVYGRDTGHKIQQEGSVVL